MSEIGKSDNEIEARFLVRGDSWRSKGIAVEIYQGYLSTEKQRVLRIRLKGDKATFTVKGESTGLEQDEYEFTLDNPQKAKAVIMKFSEGSPIEKIRHTIQVGEFKWEIDEFQGANAGLVIAEVELSRTEDKKRMEKSKPKWVGKEITEDWKYRNNRLAERPFSSWNAEEQRDMLRHAASNT